MAGCWEKRKKVEVSWFSDDNLIRTDTFYEGDIPEYKGEKPEKKSGKEYDYTFIGWDKEFKQLTEDTTFNAVFEETRRSYEITWLDEDGSQFDVTSVEYGTVPSHEPPEKLSTKEKCYIFEGWEETPVAVTGNATYKASFREIPRPYEITWQYEDGSVIDVTEVGYGIVPSHEVPKKQATDEYTYTFIGWGKELSAVDGPAVYTAQFTASKNSYEITWKNENGEVIDVTTVEYGEIPQHEALFKKADPQFEYTFTGWSPSLKAVTGAAEYTAQFSETVNSHEIVWKDENGNIIDTTTVEYGSMPLHPDLNNKETKEFFYEFEGWEPELKEVTGPAEYQAKFLETRKSYEIIWKYENGLVIDAKTWEYGTVPSCEDPEMEATPEFNYVFAGWDPEITEVDGTAVYTAKFTPVRRSYVITWQDDEGNVFDTTVAEYGSVPSHKDPVKKETDEFIYSFKGWNRDFKAVAGPETYIARFDKTRRSYEITWKNDDGSVIDVTNAEYGTVPKHADVMKNDTAEYSYEFEGWSPDITAVSGKAEYQAKFKATKRSYEITWKNEDGSVIDVTNVEYGIVPEHANPEKAATGDYTYEFAGWDKEVVAVTGSAEYTAKFTEKKIVHENPTPQTPSNNNSSTQTPSNNNSSTQQAVNENPAPTPVDEPVQNKKSYKITWKYEDGTKIDSTMVEEGQVPVHADPVMKATKEHTYEFIGWDKEPAKVTGPATYTAMFRRIKNVYSVHFESNGGTTVADLTAEYGDHINKPAEPERDGYTFKGWYKDEGLSKTYNFNEPVKEDITVYAKWEKKEEQISENPETNDTVEEITPEPAEKGSVNIKVVLGIIAGAATLLIGGVAIAFFIFRKRF